MKIQQNLNWTNSLSLMNKVRLHISRLLVIFFFMSCDCNDCNSLYTTSATIFFINETSVVVRSDNKLGYVIQPGETIVHKESHTNEYGKKPSISNYDPFATNNSLFLYENNSKCEYGLSNIENYENKKEVSPLEFEFTFRFTEEKRKNSEPCNL